MQPTIEGDLFKKKTIERDILKIKSNKRTFRQKSAEKNCETIQQKEWRLQNTNIQKRVEKRIRARRDVSMI